MKHLTSGLFYIQRLLTENGSSFRSNLKEYVKDSLYPELYVVYRETILCYKL